MIFSYSKFKRISGKSLLIFFLVGLINPVIANKNPFEEQEKIEVNTNDKNDLQTNSYILGPGDIIGLKLFDIPIEPE